MSPSPPTLKLGSFDRWATPDNVRGLVRPYHEEGMSETRLRGEKDGEWVSLREVAGTHVRATQEALRRAGFYPQGELSGVFDYRTLSAVRLFQEYVRSVEGRADIGLPDGVAGPSTHAHVARWSAANQQADWARQAAETQMPEFRYWIRVLNRYHVLNAQRPLSRVVELVNGFFDAADTLKIGHWRLQPDVIHLIGIRRQEWRRAPRRRNDDLFVLLINGAVWKFYGSTDPNPMQAKRSDEPYIVRGQHRYRFGWHKLSDQSRVYRAFRPAGPGVLVCRDALNDDALTDDDLRAGLSANPTINIHWSGAGTFNWSAGCQVIAGRRYVNHQGQTVDCVAFAARTYADLPGKTRGAYNVLLDLISVFAPSVSVAAGPSVYYTVLYERDLGVEVTPGQTLGAAALADLGPDSERVQHSATIEGLVASLVDAP